MLKILDISKYQPVVDYAKVAKEVDGVILRIGITYWGKQEMGVDPYFEQHYKGFKAQGIPVGVYYYSAADTIEKAKQEAEFCLSLLKGKQFELPIFYDVENNERQGKLTKQQLTDITLTFCSQLQSAGYFVGYYSYTSWLQTKFDTKRLSSLFSLWKADYRTNYDTAIPCDMHQYTSSGKVNGINGRVDLNNGFKDYVTAIKNAGLNGFDKEITIQPISENPIQLSVGFATGGDIKYLANFIYSLGITADTESTVGYIITGKASKGDQVKIITQADKLGIPVQEYIHVEQGCTECDDLNETLKQVVAENYRLNQILNKLNLVLGEV